MDSLGNRGTVTHRIKGRVFDDKLTPPRIVPGLWLASCGRQVYYYDWDRPWVGSWFGVTCRSCLGLREPREKHSPPADDPATLPFGTDSE
jgi:hypothetical protein